MAQNRFNKKVLCSRLISCNGGCWSSDCDSMFSYHAINQQSGLPFIHFSLFNPTSSYHTFLHFLDWFRSAFLLETLNLTDLLEEQHTSRGKICYHGFCGHFYAVSLLSLSDGVSKFPIFSIRTLDIWCMLLIPVRLTGTKSHLTV